MIPEEFVEFSKRFEVGFLVWINSNGPTMGRTDFFIDSMKVKVEPTEYDPLRLPAPGSKVSLIFANEWYTNRCEMGLIKGILTADGSDKVIQPLDITWSLSFDVDKYPDRIVKSWRR